MGVAVLDCPYCHAKQVGMPFAGGLVPSADFLVAHGVKPYAAGACVCPRCWKPIGVMAFSAAAMTSRTNMVETITTFARGSQSAPETDGLRVTVVPPVNEGKTALEHLPDNIARAFRQGEDNFQREGTEEASATMFRRAIDLTVKHIAPDLTGDLMPRIMTLVGSGKLPANMGDWGHQVRIIGNDGAHDVEGVTREELESAKGFTEAFLRYLITLPTEVEMRRSAIVPPVKLPTFPKVE